jgi:hypothetical protein
MGNGVSALHTAAMQGDLKALRIAVQEQPSALDAAEPVVRFVVVAGHKHSRYIFCYNPVCRAERLHSAAHSCKQGV